MSNTTLLQQARQLVQMGVIAALPLQAMATTEADTGDTAPVSTAQLQADFAGVGNYSNSGFFTGELDTSQASVSTLGLGFKLSGDRTFQDSELYNRRYSSCDDTGCDASSLYYSRGDTTGISFLWGGRVTGDFAPGDQLKAAYEFTIDWTHTATANPYDYAYVNWDLKLGFTDVPPPSPDEYYNWYASGPYNQTYADTLYDPGVIEVSGLLSSYDAPDYPSYAANGEWYWFAQLTVNLEEAGVRWTSPGDPAPANINGDYLRVIVPGNSIDVGINEVPFASAVPEPESWALTLLGLAMMGLFKRRQKRT